jgi:hypothetical protein
VSTGTGTASQVRDILRLSPREAGEVLGKIEAQTYNVVANDRRRSPRVPYREVSRLAVMLENEQAGRRTHALLPRNISRQGISLLHGKFVYDSTGCVLGLKALDGQIVPIRGRVIWCRLIGGRVHEFGAQFEDPIDLDDFVAPAAG